MNFLKILGARLFWVLVIVALSVNSAEAGYRAKVEKQFGRWIAGLWPEAKSAGISRKTFDNAFAGMKLDWKLPDLSPPGRKPKKTGKRSQAEFGSPGRYFNSRRISGLALYGRKMKQQWGESLKAIEKRYGVPQNILLAVWARETSYGRVKIPYDGLRSLATLGFMGARPQFFRPEVIAALKILQQGHVSRKGLKSSWAGAMGHTQMLPSVFLRYKVDFDGDGRANIWTSVPDALATSANFLKHKGWNRSYDWGYEIKVPASLDCTRAGPHQAKPIAQWVKSGIKRTKGRVFSPQRMKTKASLLLPAGLYGPGFLVTSNFYVLKEYNESDLYALFVGHLADRIGNDRDFVGKWVKVGTYPRWKVKQLQKVLLAEGHNIGDKLDGLVGFRTRLAVGKYQRKYGLRRDCWPGGEVFTKALRGSQ